MRYFLEVSYKGTNYSGFQAQQNANTIQAEIEKALLIILKEPINLTGSSRTDAGVHALQNFFHFDTTQLIISPKEEHIFNKTTAVGINKIRLLYNLNAVLPGDIVAKNLILVSDNAHCRFDAISREYKYFIYRQKNPFLKDRAFYFPYKLDMKKIQEASQLIKNYTDFTSFSKRNTQVKNFECKVYKSEWFIEKDCIVYHVLANRFLRGMVRALTATLLQVGRNKLSISDFESIIQAKDCTKANFAVPPQGLFLFGVNYPGKYFEK